MSYDIRICVKVEGIDKYVWYSLPKYVEPTYNLRDLFVACMDWDYEQSKYYKCSEIIGKIEHGISELRLNRQEYEQYNPPNGWGDLDEAIKVLESCRTCIYSCAESIPIEHLYFQW